MDGSTYRYGLNPAGEFVPGTVAVNFVAGTWQDNDGNAGVSETETFTVTATPSGVTTVRVRLTDNDYLQLFEVEVFERGTGTALDDSGTASQSSNYNANTGAEKAIDGDTTSGYPSSLALTGKELGAWWELDLGGAFDVETIKVYNRGVAGDRLEDAVVEALDFGGNVLWSDTITGAVNGSVHTFTVTTGPVNAAVTGVNEPPVVAAFGQPVETHAVQSAPVLLSDNNSASDALRNNTGDTGTVPSEILPPPSAAPSVSSELEPDNGGLITFTHEEIARMALPLTGNTLQPKLGTPQVRPRLE